jgi:hypothetical protein
MPIAALLLVTSSALAVAPPGRGDEVTLRDGRRLPATLTLDDAGRLRFSAADGAEVATDRVQYLRLAPARVGPFLAGVVHQVRLAGDQRITGELLGLDAGKLQLRTPWRDRLAVPRDRLVGATNLAGTLIARDEDFEEGLKAWKLSGTPRLTEGQHTSGERALVLDAPGQAAAYVLPSPFEAGSAAVNFHVPAGAVGARWQVEAEFAAPGGPEAVRVTVADAAASYAVEAPGPRQGGGTVARRPGWHRLVVAFGAASLAITIDDAVLWPGRDRGPGGPLRQVRLSCVADSGPVRGAVAFDEFILARTVDNPPRSAAGQAQDEAWLASGDQLFGRLARLDRRGLTLEGRFGQRTYSWAEARGAFFRQEAAAPATMVGAHVRVWLRPAAGSEPDELAGVLKAFGDRRLTLRHAALGDLEIDRARLLRLMPVFHGRRIELDNGARPLGDKGRPLPGVPSARAEGPAAHYSLRLDARPESARVGLSLLPLGGRADLVVNGRVVDDLAAHASPSARTAASVVVALPRDSLQAGDNTLEVRVRDEAGRRGGCVVSEVALETSP